MKNKKIFRFNAVDFLACTMVLLVIVLLGIHLYNHEFISDLGSPTQKDIEIIIESENIDEQFLVNIKTGDKVIEASSGYIFGSVKSISTHDSTEILDYSESKIIPNEKKLRVLISCSAEFDGNYYFINNQKIIVGEDYNLVVPNLYFSGKCISINPIQ